MPKAQRSRACQQCRERRVKCDETPELCQQCRRLGLRCSGPVQGSVIIDMTERVARPRQRKKREARAAAAAAAPAPAAPAPLGSADTGPGPAASSSTKPKPVAVVVVKQEPDTPEHASSPSALPLALPASRIDPIGGPPAEHTLQQQQQHHHHHLDAHRRLPALYQPSKAVPDALDRVFISHFVQRNNNSRAYYPEIPWITHLPNLHGRASKPAVRLSIRAASMAFYAVIHRDTTILVDSYRWYTMSLTCQRQSLARLGANSVPEAEEILVPIILSIYEVYAGTTTTSIWPHLEAAAKIIQLRGPANCTGIMSTLFKVMRVSDAHRAIVFNSPSFFSTPEWMTIPFIHEPKSAHQELGDILLLIPSLLAQLQVPPGSLRFFFRQPIPPNVDVRPAVTRIMGWLDDLERWAKRFPYLTTVPTEGRVVTHQMANLKILPQAGPGAAKGGNLGGREMVMPHSFIALTAATYEALRLILLCLVRKMSSHPSWTQQQQQQYHHHHTSPSSVSTSNPTSPSAHSSPTTTTSPPSSSTSPSTSTSAAAAAPPPPVLDIPALLATATSVSQHILHIADYLDATTAIGAFDVLRSVFPIVIVGLLAPRAPERERALAVLDRWEEKRGIGGLCKAWLSV